MTDHLQEFRERFSAMTDAELVEAFNREVGNSGWVSARAAYLAALREEFDARGFDYSAVSSGGGFSLRNEVKLVGKTLVLEENS